MVRYHLVLLFVLVIVGLSAGVSDDLQDELFRSKAESAAFGQGSASASASHGDEEEDDDDDDDCEERKKRSPDQEELPLTEEGAVVPVSNDGSQTEDFEPPQQY